MSKEHANAEDGVEYDESAILNKYPDASWPAFRNAYQRIGDIERMLVEIQKSRDHCILNAHGKKFIEWAKKDWASDQPVANGNKPRKRTTNRRSKEGMYFPSQVNA